MTNETSLSSQVNALVSQLVLTTGSNRRQELCQELTKACSEIDAYFTLQGVCQGQFPSLDSSIMRKAYTFLFWIRPRITESSIISCDKRYLYRFTTSSPSTADILSVEVGDWIVLDEKRIQTTLTAISVSGFNNSYDHTVQLPLTLNINQWQLVGCTHVFPYLKRPEWTLTVQGQVIATAELAYPVVDKLLDTVALQNITARSIEESPSLEMDVASLALYPMAVSATLQAVVAEAGPQSRLLPTLPPVANPTKGASLEGPKVGIPLIVHAAALQVQQASDRAIWSVHALQGRRLGSGRIVVPLQVPAGSTQTPRVGLIQPGPPKTVSADDDPDVFYVTGHVKLQNQLQLLKERHGLQGDEGVAWSVVVQEQGLLAATVMPFFLALLPPGKLFEKHEELYRDSIRHLHALYTTDLAGQLIQLLATAIETGGARVHELVLQTGVLHVLASSLRLSLLRASKVKLFQSPQPDLAELARRFSRLQEDTIAPVGTNIPRTVPTGIVEAVSRLIQVCCGPAAAKIEQLSPADRVRRTSDLALTAVFGLALDMDLWGGDALAGAAVYKTVADRYGGFCITYGYILRSQISVQYFLDALRVRYDSQPLSSDLDETGLQLSKLLTAMLLASLSNKRSITQGEHDVSACIGVLSDCPLGSLAVHVVLNGMVGVLSWCEVLPIEVACFAGEHDAEEDQKMQVASRLGRNLLIAQFHDVVAPMLLSRTVFSGEISMVQLKNQRSNELFSGYLSWESHWRLSLLLFSWVAAIAGPDGLVAAKSTGSLLLASGVAGSLQGAMDDANQDTITALFLPPPALALMIGSTLRSEWSYSDLLADRLRTMMPLLPGITVSLLSHPSYSTKETVFPAKSMKVLNEVLTAVCGAFHRVFGGSVHQMNGPRSQVRMRHDGASESIKSAKTYVPHLLIVSMVLESHIAVRSDASAAKPVMVFRPDVARELPKSEMESWVDISHSISESVIDEVTCVAAPTDSEMNSVAVAGFLHSCVIKVLNTAAGLITNAMNHGGAGAAVSIWQTVLSTLEESVAYITSNTNRRASGGASKDPVTNDKDGVESRQGNAKNIALDIICRLISLVLVKSMKRHDKWEVWSYEMSSGVAKVCLLIEENELLKRPRATTSLGTLCLNDAQILLVSTVLEVLSYGRDASGWCQLSLPAMNTSLSEGTGFRLDKDLSAASKLLLPVLRPALRSVFDCLDYLTSDLVVLVPELSSTSKDAESPMPRLQNLLEWNLSELDSTLTAAIVGLSFSNARETALYAMATLRKIWNHYTLSGQIETADLFASLLIKVSEELRVRYEGERRLRETALFDAYEDDATDAARDARDDSQTIERLLFGGDLLGLGGLTTEEIQFSAENAGHKSTVSQDFVLFHEPTSSNNGGDNNRPTHSLGYAQYEGLGAALEECKTLYRSGEETGAAEIEKIAAVLAPYLDAWDASARRDEEESELVELFASSLKTDEVGVTTAIPLLDPSQQIVIAGSETAADAMSAFFEFAATEKSRLKEISHRFLPSHRYSRMAYAERFCWSTYMEFTSKDDLWERGVRDGNRDIRSRLATVPCFPHFRRYIPKYLDHYADYEAETKTGVGPDSPVKDLRRASVADEMDAFTKSLLALGKLEIVDITKQDTAEEDDDLEVCTRNRNTTTGSMDEDELVVFTEGPAGNDPVDYALRKHESSRDSGRMSAENHVKASTEAPDDASFSENEDESTAFFGESNSKGHHHITTSAFATPPDNASSSLNLMYSAAAGMIEQHLDNCLHVTAEGSRHCTLLLTETHLILEYEGDPEGYFDGEMLAAQEDADRQKMVKDAGEYRENDPEVVYYQRVEKRRREIAALRPKSIRWNLSEVSHVYLRRYRLRDSALEMFFIPSGGSSFGGYGIYAPSSSLFIDFGPGREGNTRRDDAAFAIMQRSPPQAIKQWPDRSAQFLHDQLSRLTMGWVESRISNFDYLLHLNILAGRSYNDICQYPVFPWVLSDYTSDEVPDLNDLRNFRDLSKPVGALNPERLSEFLERFNTFADPSIPPFMYGSHYSTSAGVVLHFLVRLHPFAGLHRQLQSGHFDVADRLFSSVPRTWSMCTGTSAAEVKELTPEWYCNPAFLKNTNDFKLGTSQDGDVLGDVELPPWAHGNPEKFVEVMRAALESEVCSSMLPDWIDLIFGRKQQGPEAIKANNVFFYLTYYGSVDVASIEDEALRQATELQIAHFGQCPMQLFRRPHVRRIPMSSKKLNLFQVITKNANGIMNARKMSNVDRLSEGQGEVREDKNPQMLPFLSAPLSHWVHLDAPPPGPHAALVAVRFAGTDRCLAVDSRGIFHSFRWAWRAEDRGDDTEDDAWFDSGCFVAQRELPRFRSVPRLMHTNHGGKVPAVAVSKTLFAGRSVVLVLSDGDGKGGLGMQLVDPAKGQVRGEALVADVHSASISCIVTDPIGTAAGHGGVGGELAIIGSNDGSASIWRFMSSHYLPLRPRVRLSGHSGSKIYGVSLCSSIHVAAAISAERCCLYSIGNGSILRSFSPPKDAIQLPTSDSTRTVTKFANTPALAVSVQGFIVTVCETEIRVDNSPRTVITLHLFTIEGISLGSKPLEKWRGLPHKIQATPDGTAAFVCCGRGITIHRLAACEPLEIIDEWQITEADTIGIAEIDTAFDIDLGPSLNRPVVAAAACSNGVLRLHALPGISAWSERHKKSGLSQTVGTALAKPAEKFNRVFREGIGFGSRLAGMGRDIGREVTSDVKERGVGGFIGNFISRKNSSNVSPSTSKDDNN